MKKTLNYLYAFKKNEMFFPSWISIFINPFYFARKNLNRAISSHAGKLSGRMLDVGCGTKPYEKLFNVEVYTGLEYENPRSRQLNIADEFYVGSLSMWG